MGKRVYSLFLFALVFGSVAHADADKTSDLMKARTDYQRMLTESRTAQSKEQLDRAEEQLKYAEAHKLYAEAEYLRAKINHMRAFTQIMVAEYNRVQMEEHNLKKRMFEVRQNWDLCGELAEGSTRRGAFQCLQYFRRYVVSFALQKKLLFDDKVEALPVSEFFPNYAGTPLTPFPGGNVGQLILFAEAHDYSFAPYGRAHTTIVSFLDAIQVAAQAKIMEYRIYIDGIRAGALDVFKLPNN